MICLDRVISDARTRWNLGWLGLWCTAVVLAPGLLLAPFLPAPFGFFAACLAVIAIGVLVHWKRTQASFALHPAERQTSLVCFCWMVPGIVFCLAIMAFGA